ncbi:RGMB [Cordylochernes scorpioides]|uniref:RGMB n=1 Tax=Cordylochernes scorpioides TaxID=51811 RepID=A0ABY6KHG3_9ARAC|nr:RGMB [Cordylochernes scorpioides]
MSLRVCAAGAHCEVNKCARAIKEDHISPGPTYHFCTLLESYDRCVKATAKGCRGILEFHSVSSLVINWQLRFNCSEVIARGPPPSTPVPHLRRPTALPGCSYRGLHQGHLNFSHCALFGDPHLRTFHNDFQTCQLTGAWPLIANPFLAVQVTNEPVMPGSTVTATTRWPRWNVCVQVTVIIREHHLCTKEKTYEARMDSLPSTFVDGTRTGGPDRGVRIREEDPGRHVEIHARHLAARIVLRRVGRYLTFAAKLPTDLAATGMRQAATDGTLELCNQGCPIPERINYHQALSGSGGEEPSAASTTSPGAYYDACLFDLLTTGDISFSEAARDALKDVLNLYPSLALINRTFSSNNQVAAAAVVVTAAGPGRPEILPSVLLLMYLLVAYFLGPT